MDEALRLAYLAAMEIPVWVLRDAGEPEPVAEPEMDAVFEVPDATPAAAASGGAPGRLVRELLGATAAHGSVMQRLTSTVDTARKEPATEQDAGAGERVPALLLVMAGRQLFIAEAGATERDRRVATLASAIAFALDGERAAASMQRFDPAAGGMEADRAGARDMLLGRLARLTESAGYEQLIVLGPTAARSLLGWDEREYMQRKPVRQPVAGLGVDALVTLAADTLLHDPLSKGEAWRELCGMRAGHAG